MCRHRQSTIKSCLKAINTILQTIYASAWTRCRRVLALFVLNQEWNIFHIVKTVHFELQKSTQKSHVVLGTATNDKLRMSEF